MVKHASLGLSSSVSTLTASWYLGISNNLGNANLSKEDLDYPESVRYGLKKAALCCFKEVRSGITGLYH
jgi:hypothetical protein